MANEEHLEILEQGVEAWNRWREENPGIRPDLREAYLREAYLREANLREANLGLADLREAYLFVADLREAYLMVADLREADLSGANLSEANLFGANPREANLSGANLRRANLGLAKLVEADLSGADLWRANLCEADLSGANLSGANLSGASLVETNLAKADLTGCKVYGISAWNLNLEGAIQSNLIISRHDEPIITVDNLEVAQFIYLLLNHKKLRDVLNAVTERGVLILGRFGGGGLELLQAIAAKLRELNYLPIIFDFDKPESRNFTETIKTLAGLSRFVIADLSGPSVPQELYATVPHFKIPFVPIIEKGRKKYAMFVDLLEYPWVLSPVEFENEAQLLELLPGEIIDPAEEKHQERQKLLNELFKADEG